jgi:hypothetical protein
MCGEDLAEDTNEGATDGPERRGDLMVFWGNGNSAGEGRFLSRGEMGFL